MHLLRILSCYGLFYVKPVCESRHIIINTINREIVDIKQNSVVF